MKIAFNNTLWFLVPSGGIFLLGIGMGIWNDFDDIDVLFNTGYYFLLLPNIPFFFASWLFLSLIQRGWRRITASVLSGIFAVVIWFLSFSLSRPLIHLGDIGFGGILLILIAFLSLATFLIRSIVITTGTARPDRASGVRKEISIWLAIFLAVAVLFLFIFFV